MPDGSIHPILPRQLLTAAQVAMRLSRTATWFYHNRPQLERTAEVEAAPPALPAEPVWMTLTEYAKARGLTRDALHKAMRAGRLTLPVRRDERTKRGTYRVLVSPADLQAPAARVVWTPAKAATAVRVLRLLLQNAERLGYLAPGANPARRPGLSTERQRDPVLWSPELVRHMATTADEMGWRSVATAILLNEWLGQREGDILALKPWRVEAEALQLQQGKRRWIVRLPVHVVPHLVGRLRGEAERPGAVASLEHLLLHDRTGQAWGEHTLRHIFAEVRARAAQAMPGCTELRFMELRHTAVTRLHEAGVDELGIAGITGHSPRTVREILDRHYLVRTERAAERAFRLRLTAEAEQ